MVNTSIAKVDKLFDEGRQSYFEQDQILQATKLQNVWLFVLVMCFDANRIVDEAKVIPIVIKEQFDSQPYYPNSKAMQ